MLVSSFKPYKLLSNSTSLRSKLSLNNAAALINLLSWQTALNVFTLPILLIALNQSHVDNA